MINSKLDFKTPCYIFDQEEFNNNIETFEKCLWEIFGDKSILGYSFKTNSLPYLIECAKKSGCYAEVVSEREYYLAKYLGYKIENIIYNGPVKTEKSFFDAIENGAIINIDSEREISWLKKLPKDKNYKIGIRVNFDLESILPNQTLMGEEGGRFGFCDENGSLTEVIKKIKKMKNIEIECLHMHVSSKTKSVEIFKELTKRACDIVKREDLAINYIDVGGSFFGGGDGGNAYYKYMKAIKEILVAQNMDKINIIVEPGASVAATSMKYVVKVIDTKETVRNNFVITDGSRLHIDPFFTRDKYKFCLYTDSDEIVDSQIICGFTCMEKDRFMKVTGEKKILSGDYIVFDIVGSYTLCFNSDFISMEPRVYAKTKGKLKLVRDIKEITNYFEYNYLEVNK